MGGFKKHDMKCNHICIMGIPKGRESEEGIKNLFGETMTQNFPNQMKKKEAQFQEVQEAPNKMALKGPHQETS